MSADQAPARSDQGRGPDRRLALILCTLLAFGAGGTEAIAFERLGNVFAGVMTGNLVLFGVALGSGESPVAGRAGVALAAFAVGVFASGLIASRSSRPDVVWSRRITAVLAVEFVLFTGFAVGWQLADAQPGGTARAILLATAALAMGLQSGAVVAIGIDGLSTTYVTGTLTGVLATLAHSHRLRVPGVIILASLLAGAALSAFLIEHEPRLAAFVPLCLLGAVVAAALRAARA